MPEISVVICAHNPERTRLKRVLEALSAQDLSHHRFEVLLIDNGSEPTLTKNDLNDLPSLPIKIVPEPRLGLTHARATGFREARGSITVLVDDDNELAFNYLSETRAFLEQRPDIGVIGGPCIPEFDGPIPSWAQEFLPLLALRDLGKEPLIHSGEHGLSHGYPSFSPIGAGMAIRTSLAQHWASNRALDENGLIDRCGSALSSAGDNDIVFSCLRQYAGVAYLPTLRVTHLLSVSRLDPFYLAKLNEGIQRSWQQVLAIHGVSPWQPISASGQDFELLVLGGDIVHGVVISSA
ncbi:MAG: glycosyltransferase family 2 protein [Ahniella sp.]|nr:glycosyltransferase family 2 protein [Ahniella sp.]